MKTAFRKSFGKDLRQLERNADVLNSIKEIIVQIEEADNAAAVKNLNKLKYRCNYYRIRIDNSRVGLTIEDQRSHS